MAALVRGLALQNRPLWSELDSPAANLQPIIGRKKAPRGEPRGAFTKKLRFGVPQMLQLHVRQQTGFCYRLCRQ